jgi:outer membrane protein insertion porin family
LRGGGRTAGRTDRVARVSRGVSTVSAVAFVAFGLCSSPAGAARLVSEVRIEGNVRVETSAIEVHKGQGIGVPIDQAAIDADIKAIYAMGFFDKVWVTAGEGDRGLVVVYHVTERPYIVSIKFEGVKKVKPEDLEAVINVTSRTIFDPQRAWAGVQAAKKFYTSEGYPDALVEFAVAADAQNAATLVYTIDEGEKVRITEIRLEGVRAFKPSKLRKLMTTRKKWMFSFLTGAGLLNEDELNTDVERLNAFYYDNGYIHARVDEPRIDRVKDGLVVTLKVEEGPLFRVGEVSFEGDVLLDDGEMRRVLGIKRGDVFRASALRDAIFDLTESYGDLGHAFAEIVPDTRVSEAREEVDIKFSFSSGPVVKIRRIDVRGNTKTRDKVVRRELSMQEGQKFTGSGLQRSKRAVTQLGFFETVELTTARTENDDEVDLIVDVKEQRTGSFSAGAGFSSADALLLNARISEQNLFGRGQTMVFNVDFGTVRQNFQLSFTEPWFMGRPLAAGIDLFNWRLDFDRFRRGSAGFGLRASYPLVNLGLHSFYGMSLNRIRGGLEYRLENASIDGTSLRAPPDVVAEEGTRLTSSMSPTFVRNTLDHPFDPNSGSRQRLTGKFAGIGGDSNYFKIDLSGRWFIPVFQIFKRQITYSFGGTIGFGLGQDGESGQELPVFERYFPGGINSVRGFEARKLGPTQQVCSPTGSNSGPTDECTQEEIGGSQQVIVNNELIFPILREAGFKGVVFFDVGNAFLADPGIRLSDFRLAAGWGFRWLSPFGPLRVEIGYPLDKKDGEDTQVVLFSFGSPF